MEDNAEITIDIKHVLNVVQTLGKVLIDNDHAQPENVEEFISTLLAIAVVFWSMADVNTAGRASSDDEGIKDMTDIFERARLMSATAVPPEPKLH